MHNNYKYLTFSNSATVISRIMNRAKYFYKLINLEVVFWISGLLYLAFFNDFQVNHFTICPISVLGFEHCPGCGLGNSISLLLNGYIIDSIHAHLLGIPAVIILLTRIYTILKSNNNYYIKIKSEERNSYA